MVNPFRALLRGRGRGREGLEAVLGVYWKSDEPDEVWFMRKSPLWGDFREENRRIQAIHRGPERHGLLTNPMKRG
jgi:hypothetical protein